MVLIMMSWKNSLLFTILFQVIYHVYCMNADNDWFIEESTTEERNFIKLLKNAQHDNKKAAHLLNLKRSLQANGKSLPSTVYKRMKIEVLRSLKQDYLQKKRYYDEVVKRSFHHVECQPWLIPVEIKPKDEYHMNHPSFIELHRCLGGCRYKAPSLIHCAVSQQTSVQVGYTEFRIENGGDVNKNQVKTLQNHTDCVCECRIQEHHCHKEKERYDENECKCVCKELNCTHKQEWNQDECKCKCKKAKSCGAKVWSENTCQCECDKREENKCLKSNKEINPETCKCQCSPKIQCPPGSTLSEYDCKCSTTA
ncbi:balbiani ring protein 3-like [Xenia sp. Carnegie-2017]|uniref:balbiani ring protein 3-like n=1 Tax=Xenia sp. Carnegie-2017 TaxID=2897299 RepID=UPI001F03E2EB|nr:balbiani ring protein 3-like [Xenia sp. Carnegie-2017]